MARPGFEFAPTSSMQIIPVIDIKDGIAVHAVQVPSAASVHHASRKCVAEATHLWPPPGWSLVPAQSAVGAKIFPSPSTESGEQHAPTGPQ